MIEPLKAVSRKIMQESRVSTRLYLSILIGLMMVTLWLGAYTTSVKFPVSNDGVGYLQDARNLLDGNGLRRTTVFGPPYDVEVAPSAHFPPGYPILIAGLSPFVPTLTDAAIWIARLSWVLLPLAVTFCLGFVVRRSWALLCGALVAFSPSVYLYGHGTFSDIPYVVLAAMCVGLLIRAVGESEQRRSLSMLVLAGLIASLAYSLRNAGTALFLAVFAAFALGAVFRVMPLREAARGLVWFGMGALPILAALFVRNYFMFGALQPYHVLRGQYATLLNSARTYIESLLLDLSGSQAIARHLAWDFKILVIIAVPVLWLLLTGLWRQWRSHNRQVQFATLILSMFVLIGALMLVVAHSFTGLDQGNLTRHLSPYGWAVCGLAAMVIGGLIQRWSNKGVALALAVVTGLFALRAAFIVGDLREELATRAQLSREHDLAQAVRLVNPQERNYRHQLKYRLAEDQALLRAAARIPEGGYLVSNHGNYLTYVLGRRVHNLEFDELRGLAEAFPPLERAAAALGDGRTVFLLLIPTNRVLTNPEPERWQQRALDQLPDGFVVFAKTDNLLVIKYGR